MFEFFSCVLPHKKQNKKSKNSRVDIKKKLKNYNNQPTQTNIYMYVKSENLRGLSGGRVNTPPPPQKKIRVIPGLLTRSPPPLKTD
jgi:hypothetical protein